MVARQRRINFRAPGVDAAAETLHFAETVALKIRRRVHAARALMIVNDDELIARPLPENLLHQLLREEVRLGQFNGFPFLARADIEELDLLAGCEALR